MTEVAMLIFLFAVPPAGLAENSSTGDSLIHIVDSYFFDSTSLNYSPQYEERIRHTYAGGIYYEHVTRPESWSFDIVRAGRRIPCKILCPERGGPEFTRGENMPMGVLRYLQTHICEKKESFRQMK